MIRIHLILFLMAVTGFQAVNAQDFSGSYSGLLNDTENVTLVLRETTKNNYSGTLKDSQQTYEVTASVASGQLTGLATESSLGFSFDLKATLNGPALTLVLSIMGTNTTVIMTKETARPIAGAPAAVVKKGKQDPALVGKWTLQSNYSSGYGQDGTMSQEESIIFNGDGTISDGGSRTVVGGGNWSGTGSTAGGAPVPGLSWHTENQQLYITATENGKTSTAHLGRYYIENNNMLITGTDGTKVLYYKN